MNYPLYLARRLSLSSGGRKSSPAVRVAVAAVALSVAVMIASIAIVLGFKREIRDKVIGFNSHITLFSVPQDPEENNIVNLTPSLSGLLEEIPYITDFSLDVSMPAILKTSDNFKGVYLRSLAGRQTSDFIKSNLEEGSIPDYSKDENKQKVVISRIAARQLGLKTGDRIDTYFITDDVRVRRLEVAGIYNSHFDNYDDVYLYGSLPMIQGIAGLSPTQGTAMLISTDDFNNLQENTSALQNRLIEAVADGTLYKYYRVDNALNQGAGYFRWLSACWTPMSLW